MMVRMTLRVMTVMMVVTVRRTESMTRAVTSSEPCYYQPYYKQLTCSCHAESLSPVTRGSHPRHATFLNIKLGYYVRQLGQEVRSVLVQSCSRLRLGLDLLGVNPTNIPIKIKRSGQVLVDFIILDPAWADIQTLSLEFRHVDNVTFHQLHVDNTAFITANDVKHFRISETTFVNQTERSVAINNCQDLVITRNIFLKLDAGTFQVSGARHVAVMDNQMNINAMSAFQTKESSNLYISCNRVPGSPVSPDCHPDVRKYRHYLSTSTTSTTTTTTTTTTTLTVSEAVINKLAINTSSTHSSPLSTDLHIKTNNTDILIADSQPLLYFLSSLCVALAVAVLVLVYIYKSNTLCQRLSLGKLYSSVPSPQIPRPPPPPPMQRPASSSGIAKEIKNEAIGSDSGEDSGSDTSRSTAPAAWITEIQQNELFRKVRQKIEN